ncbi:acyl carrier protein [Shewanella sp. MBTL60-007]|uniref:acyl carrier protein n=1 Tax=Shewanella sp. MBTL60-007 TaxID=2815911 RepID=UPI001BC4A106|nr:acyl carrier protein [Shewanella sp. MBTL60-007]GIU33146.1 acyl carrier protein [Shewanella sp. MBTL60-007]
MTNQEKLNTIFSAVLGINIDNVTEDLRADSVPNWDSIAHMTLVAELEEQFNISLDFDQISEINSYNKVKEVLIFLGVNF